MKRYQYNNTEERLIVIIDDDIIINDDIIGDTLIKKCLCVYCKRINRVRYPKHVTWMWCSTCSWCGKDFWMYCKGNLGYYGFGIKSNTIKQ